MFHAIRKARLKKAIIKADFFHNCPRSDVRIELIHFAFDHLNRKPQTATQLFAEWDGQWNGHFRALAFVEITVMHWMVENRFAKTEIINGDTYYYI